MIKLRRTSAMILVTALLVILLGQLQAQTTQQGKPAETVKPVAESSKGKALQLTGLTMKVPAGWDEEKIEPTPLGPKAVFKIPKTDPNGEDGTVRITHFPDMKGKDEINIDRWLGQVTKPDGQPMTRLDAKITTLESASLRLTTVDMSGSAKLTMRDTAKPNQRMIAAIVDHPKGPHFVVSAGPVASMEKWAAQIDAFLKSAKVE